MELNIGKLEIQRPCFLLLFFPAQVVLIIDPAGLFITNLRRIIFISLAGV